MLLVQPRPIWLLLLLVTYDMLALLFGIPYLIISDLYRLLNCLQIQSKTHHYSGARLAPLDPNNFYPQRF